MKERPGNKQSICLYALHDNEARNHAWKTLWFYSLLLCMQTLLRFQKFRLNPSEPMPFSTKEHALGFLRQRTDLQDREFASGPCHSNPSFEF